MVPERPLRSVERKSAPLVPGCRAIPAEGRQRAWLALTRDKPGTKIVDER